MGLFQRLLSAIGRRKRDHDDELGDSETDSGAGSSSSSFDRVQVTVEDIEHDFELEAKDDFACFDFARDIARYFTAEFRIEQAWTNEPRRAQLFGEYQIRDATHWYQVQATFGRWLASTEGKAKYPSKSALNQARMTTTQTVTVDELESMIEDARRANR